MNDAGIGACVNTLPAPSREVGVPHYFTLRGIYECLTLEDAKHAVQRAERAIPANIALATPQGPADLEITVDDVHVLHANEDGWPTHTNHCIHRDLTRINADFPELIQSYPRLNRVSQLLAQVDSRLDIDRVKTVLRDHNDRPTSICRHTNDDPDTGFWVAVFSVIIETDKRRMHASRGTPCDHPYEVYEF